MEYGFELLIFMTVDVWCYVLSKKEVVSKKWYYMIPGGGIVAIAKSQ